MRAPCRIRTSLAYILSPPAAGKPIRHPPESHEKSHSHVLVTPRHAILPRSDVLVAAGDGTAMQAFAELIAGGIAMPALQDRRTEYAITKALRSNCCA